MVVITGIEKVSPGSTRSGEIIVETTLYCEFTRALYFLTAGAIGMAVVRIIIYK